MTAWRLSAASAALSYLAWSGPEWVGLAALVPLLWALSESRKEAFVALMAYYLVGARSIPDSAGAFFAFEGSYLAGVLMWLASSAINASVWAACWTRTWTAAAIAWRPLACSIALALPGAGVIGWLNPWLGTSSIFPGLGWWSIALGATILVGATALAKLPSMAWGMALVSLMASQVALRDAAPISPPDGWVALSPRWGGMPTQGSKDEMTRFIGIGNAANEAFANGATVVVLPEQIAGYWSSRQSAFFKSYLGRNLERGGVVVVGSAYATANGFENAIYVLSKQGEEAVRGRQSVPFSMWRPWSPKSHYPAHWWRNNVFELAGEKVALSICYEDFLFGLGLLSFLHDTPTVLLSVANGWWAANSNVMEVQRLHVETLAKVFGVPLIRAVNQPGES